MLTWRVAIKAWSWADVRDICFLHGENILIFTAGEFAFQSAFVFIKETPLWKLGQAHVQRYRRQVCNPHIPLWHR